MPDTRYIDEVLTYDEKLIEQFGYHWTYFMKPKYFVSHVFPPIIGFVIWFVLMATSTFPLDAILVTAFSVVITMILWIILWKVITCDVRIVTDRRIIEKKGFFHRNTSELKLSAIESITFDQNIWQRLLRVGCLSIIGRGGGENVRFHAVRRPMVKKNMIENIDWYENGSEVKAYG